MACDSKQSGRLGEERGTKVDIPASSAAVGGGCVAGQGSAEPIPGEVPRGGSLTADQAERYEEEGYLVLPDLLDDEDLAPARAAMMQKVDQMAADLLAGGLITDPLIDEPFRTRLARLFDGLGEEEFLAYGRSWRDRLPGYFVLMSNPKILDAVESLIGPEIYSNPVYNVRPKVPRVAAGAVPWHQDKSYWPDANSNPVITVWISLVDATLDNGCLHMIPRTQREQLLNFGEETYSGTGYLQVEDRHFDQSLRSRVRVAARQDWNSRPLQRPAHPLLNSEQFRPRPLERGPALPTHRPGSDAPVRRGVPRTQPRAPRARGEPGGLARRASGGIARRLNSSEHPAAAVISSALTTGGRRLRTRA